MLTDEPDIIVSKIRKAVTDNGGEIRYGEDKPGVTNLMTIYAAIERISLDEVATRFAGARYGDLKNAVAETVVEELRPVRERYSVFDADRGELLKELARGAERARLIASGTLALASDAIGLLAPARLPVRLAA